jgi:putative hydrolase of the HAD superfamily
MKKKSSITTLFLDVGDVLLTDGWGHDFRKQAAEAFNLNLKEIEKRHAEALETFELGRLSINEFLNWVVFYEKRPFTQAQFQKYMFAQSKPFPNMIELARRLKTRYGLKIVVVSNEGRELNDYRIRKFKLDEFVDIFISSCFIDMRKPDLAMYHTALDVSRVSAKQVLYIENTPMFVEIAKGLGIQTILHTNYRATCSRLAAFGLEA